LLIGFPIALYLVTGVWCLLPERRPGFFVRHPERLLRPSLAVYPLNVIVGLLIWRSL
jgi:hypothetical protein